MARSTSEIDAIIAGLKTNRDTRDAYIEGKAAAFDDSNAYEANQIRGLKHTQSKLLDIWLCVSCKAMKDRDGGVIGFQCTKYLIEDIPNRGRDGETEQGLKTLLVDESFTITGSNTVENL